jgi:hypothetical protein
MNWTAFRKTAITMGKISGLVFVSGGLGALIAELQWNGHSRAAAWLALGCGVAIWGWVAVGIYRIYAEQ